MQAGRRGRKEAVPGPAAAAAAAAAAPVFHARRLSIEERAPRAGMLGNGKGQAGPAKGARGRASLRSFSGDAVVAWAWSHAAKVRLPPPFLSLSSRGCWCCGRAKRPAGQPRPALKRKKKPLVPAASQGEPLTQPGAFQASQP